MTAFVRHLANGVLCGLTSRKNTGYKHRQVFDVVCIEIAYTTAAVMLRKFKQKSSPYNVSNIIESKDFAHLKISFFAKICTRLD